MSRGLNYDNKILAIVNAVVDIIILGIFWFVTSIPIFTIGASTSAVYYTSNKCIRNAMLMWNTGKLLRAISNNPHSRGLYG